MNAGNAGQEPVAGREIAGYRLLHALGAGGASEVYLAQRLDSPAALVAMKILRPFTGLDAAAAAAVETRFLREAEAARRLTHPHILPVLAYGRDDGLDYMALPFMAGGTLTARINAFTRGMPLPLAAEYLTQIASALDYAHEHGVIHRDVKPANVLLDADGALKLADFGIARVFEGAGQSALATLSVEGQLLGTPAYMAPEQLDGPRVSRQADIYALGVTLYQMVTGALPFEADTPIALAMRRLQTEPPPPRRDRAELPAPAQAAILRALARRPEDRYATAGALARAFDAGIRGQFAPDEALGAPAVVTPHDDWLEQAAPPGSGASTMATSASPRPDGWGAQVDAPPAESRQASRETAWRAQNAPTAPDPRIGGRGRGAPALWMLVGITLTLVAIVAGVLMSGPLTTALGLSGSGLGIFGDAATATRTTAPAVTATAPASAACKALSGFGAATTPAYAGPAFADVPFPAGAVSVVQETFVDGSYHFILLNVCAPNTSAASVRSFYTQAMPVNNWISSATYPYAGQPDKSCGDVYCWTKGTSPARYASLEAVTTRGALVTYQLRLGKLA